MKVVVVLAVFFAGAAMAWMILLPRALARTIRARTGFEVEIQSFYCNLFTANLVVRGLVITNPPKFPRKEFVNLREFRVAARPASLLGRRWEAEDVTVDLAALALVRDESGRVNARLFEEGLAGPAGKRPSPNGAKDTNEKKERDFLIKHLTLRIDRLVIADYSLHSPETREYNLNFNRSYENVTSGKQLAAPFAEALGSLAGSLAGLVPESGGVLRETGNTLKQAGRKAGEAVKGLFESLEKSIRQ